LDHDFLVHIEKMGLLDRLNEKIKEAEKSGRWGK